MMKKIFALIFVLCLMPRMTLSAATSCSNASACAAGQVCKAGALGTANTCFACAGTYNKADQSALNGMGACYKEVSVTLGEKWEYEDNSVALKCNTHAVRDGSKYACKCEDHYTQSGTGSTATCNPNVYKIVLHYSSSSSYTRYVKYGVGFGTSSSSTASFLVGLTMPVPTKNKYTFGGYYTGEDGTGTQVFDKEGNVVVNNPTTYFTNEVTDLYANWIPDFSIKYMVKNTSGTEACSLTESCTSSRDCKVVKKLADISSKCSEQQIQSAQPSKIFQNWSCGGKVVQAGQDDMSWTSSATTNDKTIECVAQFRDCLAGYYCVTNGKEEACPRGTTSDAGATANTKCYISSDTVFLDAVGSFKLSVSSNPKVYYYK